MGSKYRQEFTKMYKSYLILLPNDLVKIEAIKMFLYSTLCSTLAYRRALFKKKSLEKVLKFLRGILF